MFFIGQVGCEGYEYPEDPFILKGSCQLVYSLNAPRWDARPRDYNSRQSWENTESAGSDFSTRVATWAALGMIGFVLYTIFQIFTERAPGGWRGRRVRVDDAGRVVAGAFLVLLF